MTNFRELYFKLFAAMADAVELMEQKKYDQAMQTLIRAQQEAEERYISGEVN